MKLSRIGKKRIIVPTAWAALAIGAVSEYSFISPTLAQDPRPVSSRADSPNREPEKTVAFEMRDKPWGAVLEWLADQSGLPVSTIHKPTGTFTFIAPKSLSERRYTISQVIDILNEALVNQKYILIRRNQSFTIVPSDEKIDPAILPQLNVEDLDYRGKSELAQVVLPLKSLVAEDLAPEVKKMMGPFGEVVPMARANQLVLQDTVGNLRRVIHIIGDIENNDKSSSDQFSHVCIWIKARDAEKVLKEQLGDPLAAVRAAVQEQTRNNQGGGFPGGFPGGGRGGQGATPIQLPKVRMHQITADERTNTILVTGPADKINQARQILRSIDVNQPGQPKTIIGPALFKTYAVPGGNADAIAKTLQTIYQSSNVTRISAVGSNSIMVYALPEDQIEIAKHITSAREDSSAPELVTLNNLDATKAVTTLQGMFGSDAKTGAPFLEADTGRNAVVVKGTIEQVRDVKEALKALGETSATGGPVIVNISQGSAAALAEELERLLSNMRIKVKVNTPGALERKLEKKPDSDPNRPGGGNEEQEQPPSTGQLFDPQAQTKPGNKNSPVTITVVGNQLIITSDDPEALRMANSLVRLLSQSPKGEGDFEIIHLKNASATEAAKVLDEAFNGVKSTTQQQPGAGFGPAAFFNRFAQQQAPPANPTAGRIRVVADVGSNSLLVRASPLDMLAIRRLLDKAIDSGDTDSKALIKRHMLPPLKAASASEVVQTLKEVFREQLNPNAVSEQIGFGPGGGFRGRINVNRNIDANGNPITTALTIGMDERTNRIWVSCSDALFEDVAKVVKDLDEAAKDAPRTVRFVTIRGLDPLVVQQAIDAIQGRRPAASTAAGNNQGGFGGQGFGGFGGFGGPGFGRGFGGQGFGGPGGGGQGFGPGGGGGQGFVPGGGGGRGNNNGGGGGVGPRPGGGGGQGMRPGGQQNRGPSFFDHGVTDDPRTFSFFDPQHVLDGGTAADSSNLAAAGGAVQQAGFEESQQPPSQTMDFTRPRLPVTVDALGQTDMVIINANSLEDAKLTEQIINRMQELSREAEIEIKLIPLKKGDATGVAPSLAAVYSRVIIGASGNSVRGGTTPTPQGGGFGGQQATGNQLGTSSVVLQPVPRLNAIFVAAPRIRMKDVESEINRLDVETPAQGRLIPIPLKKAPAARVAVLVNNFWSGRYPNETAAQHQVRLTYDDSVNTIFVQAAPADFAEISELIERIENTVSSAVNELRIIHLNYALADEVTNLLNQAISSEVVTPTTMPATTTTTTPGVGAPAGGTFGGAVPGAAATGTPAPTKATKSTSLRFITNQRDRRSVEAGILEDIHISPDERLNSLIIAAPAKSMDLILALVHELDAPPANRAEVKVFPLKNADASTIANTISQLYFASTTTGTTGPGPAAGGGGGLGALGAVTTPTAGTSGIPQAIFNVTGTTPEGAPLVALHLAVDQRTNSLIVAGGRNDLDVIEAVVTTLDDRGQQVRRNEVYQLHNAFAADVASALQTYFTNALQVLSTAGTGQYTSHEVIERNVVVVPEPVSNRLLISASPDYLPEVMRVIMEIDAQPPQVVIQVLVAEVDFSSDNEFGVEIGLQSPVLFNRSIIPASSFLGTGGSINYANAGAGSLVPVGVTANSTINPAAQPGFLFNQTIPLGNNPVVSPGVVGFQGLSNLGVGRASPTSGIGGFVFSAGSDSFNILVRALQTQGRIDILSRPQLQTTDNQTATINIGQQIPYIGASTVTATGVISNTIERTIVGVNLQVTPHISPDGTVMMRVTPQISSPVPTQVSLGNGTTAVAFNVQQVDTTVTAEDGQTVVIGGLISKNQQRNENKVPWLGDLPYIGTLFRYRTETKNKTELLVIMTPHIVRCRADADRIANAEAARMDWIMGNVRSVHETTGMEPIIHARDADHEHIPNLAPAPTILPPDWNAPQTQPTAPETLPKPKPATPAPAPKQGAAGPAPADAATVQQTNGVVALPAATQPAAGDATVPEPRKEKSGWSLWNVFRRD